MAEGSIFKRCNCRDDDQRRLGPRCPHLRRTGGSWSPTHGRWAYQLELPIRPKQARRQLRRGGFDTREAAAGDRDHALTLLALAGDDDTLAAAIGDLLKAVKPGKPLPSRDTVARRVRAGVTTTDTTVGDYLWSWFDGRTKPDETTLRAYESHIRVHLEPHLGHIPLHQLRGAHIQAMFDAIRDRHTAIKAAKSSVDPAVRASVKGQRAPDVTTMHRIRATLRKALNDAIHIHRILDFNPAIGVELPSATRPKPKVWTGAAITRWQATGERPSPVMVWTPAQAGTFLDYAETHDIVLYAMFALILHRGLRRGEAVGLRTTDVELESGTLTIAEQITTLGYQPIRKTVKSDAGDRVVSTGTALTTVLREYRDMRDRWQQVSGREWPDADEFFVKPDGTRWHPELVSERFDKLISAARLPPIRLHDLRHCAATYAKASGLDMKDIQELLGHATVSLTSDTYTSVVHELETERAKADIAESIVPRDPRRAA
ncbi:tyrosine-type recombinase/integrase [Asanoa sp. NPDC049518]|uniref:tyrosine-type recombinase/integrase n=1 Tax=unclassified Asanoa TaxID=2685164 RepID=UPI00341705A4